MPLMLVITYKNSIIVENKQQTMNVPKFIRKWMYKRMLKDIDQKSKYERDTFLCNFCVYNFPYKKIKYYPELWDRRHSLKYYSPNGPTLGMIWFLEQSERKKYVQEALDLLN